MNRFYVETRDGMNKLVEIQSGFATRESAEAIANARRRMIENRGWAMTVHVGEQHKVG